MHAVGVVLVNYSSGWLAQSAVESLLAQRFSGRDGKPGGEGIDRDYGNWQ